MSDIPDVIPEAPVIPYRREIVGEILRCAESYLSNAGRLIYSGGGRTCLAGYDIYDKEHENRGNIDCSTYLLLLLAGIPYERSPYATGDTSGLVKAAAPWADPKLSDFSDLPDSYRGVAEVIGRPDLPVVCNLSVGHAAPRCILPFGVEASVSLLYSRSSFSFFTALERLNCFGTRPSWIAFINCSQTPSG